MKWRSEKKSIFLLSFQNQSLNHISKIFRLQDILVEDDYGKVDCKVMIALIQKQFGSRKRNTRAWLKRAFPKSYLRRSDRNRWFCGVSLKSEHGKSVLSVKDREWFDRAVSWYVCLKTMPFSVTTPIFLHRNDYILLGQ